MFLPVFEVLVKLEDLKPASVGAFISWVLAQQLPSAWEWVWCWISALG